jgi:hypothetical protein
MTENSNVFTLSDPREQDIPRPSATTRVDQRKIKASILVLGGGADRSMLNLQQRTAPGDGGRFDLEKPAQGTYTYMPLRLGDIRGYTTELDLRRRADFSSRIIDR